MLLRNKAAIVAAIMIGAPLATAGAASAKTVTLPDCVEVAPSPAVTHQVTVVDVPAVPGTEGTPAQTHTEVVIDVPGVDAYDETVIDTPAYDETVYVFQKWRWGHINHLLKVEANVGKVGFGTWDVFPGNLGWFPDDAIIDHPYSPGDNEHNSGNDWWRKHVLKIVHHDAATHIVHHDAVPAVTHTVVVVDVPAVPGTDGKPAVTHQETVVDSPAVKGKKCPDALPHTGASAATFGIAGLGLAAIAGGSVLMATGRRRKQ